jgi:hypothetical protein
MPLVSMHSGPLAIACPKCGAGQGEHCRTLTTNRSTDTHEARREAWWAAVERRPRSDG